MARPISTSRPTWESTRTTSSTGNNAMTTTPQDVVRMPRRGAFTLLELLVVLAIIGILTAVALPSMKGLQKSNVMTAASQQLVDDIGLARQYAIKERTTVHLLFVPPDVENKTMPNN